MKIIWVGKTSSQLHYADTNWFGTTCFTFFLARTDVNVPIELSHSLVS